MILFHGGSPGLNVGDVLRPGQQRSHQPDNCPVCEARRDGRICTVGEYRRWLSQFGQAAVPLLMKLRDVPAHAPMDPPSEEQAVYVTSDEGYAAFYAGVSRGDLYRVRVVGAMRPSPTDHFPSWTVDEAVIERVMRRNVVRSRRERRELDRRWKKADARAMAVAR